MTIEMKKIQHYLVALMLLGGLITMSSCNDDEDDMNVGPEGTGELVTFPLDGVANSAAGGMVTFELMDDASTKITVELEGTVDGEMHPMHIHENTAAEGGGIAITLEDVNGSTGKSETFVTMTDDESPISFAQLVDFDGYINVHQSASDLATIVAQGDIGQNALTGESKTYTLGSVADPAISGMATFYQRKSGETLAKLMLDNTPQGGSHPAHIHLNTAAEGGAIAVSFTPVDGSTGMSKTNVASLDDGTAITYTELLEFDGYINVHLSAEDLATLVAQGDIGQNELTGDSKSYTLGSVADPAISGMATFYQRKNGETLAKLMLENTPEGGSHPAHIHLNTAAEGGAIAVSFTPVDGSTGMSKTNIASLDDGTAITYTELLEFDGYINVHLSAEDLATLVAQGDIGQNELTGEKVAYDLSSVDVEGISGTATFYQRVNDETLVAIALDNTPEGGSHPAHIHFNTAAEGGGIAVTFNNINGTTGMSKTNVTSYMDPDMNEIAISYDELLEFDGYINVHLSADDLGTLVAQGDIGQNDLTGESKTYVLNEVDVPGVSGTATFSERINGETLVTVALTGANFEGGYASHIHAGSVANAPGDIIISLNNVDANGMAKTNVSMMDGTMIDYAAMIQIDGYINVHTLDFSGLVAQGDVGVNAQ